MYVAIDLPLLRYRKTHSFSEGSTCWIMIAISVVALSKCYIDYWSFNQITFRTLIMVIMVANLTSIISWKLHALSCLVTNNQSSHCCLQGQFTLALDVMLNLHTTNWTICVNSMTMCGRGFNQAMTWAFCIENLHWHWSLNKLYIQPIKFPFHACLLVTILRPTIKVITRSRSVQALMMLYSASMGMIWAPVWFLRGTEGLKLLALTGFEIPCICFKANQILDRHKT